MEEFDKVLKELKAFLATEPVQGGVAYFLDVDSAKALIKGFQQLMEKLAE